MGWQRNLVDSSEEWTSTKTGILWRVSQEGERRHWFASYNGTPLRVEFMRGSLRPAAGGRRTWWRTVEAARRGCESYDEAVGRLIATTTAEGGKPCSS